jgi:MYXO-CTERM domain-containing protein
VGTSEFSPLSFDVTAPVVQYQGGTPVKDDACDPPTVDLTGKIALIHRGVCQFSAKAQTALAAGAAGVILYDSLDGEAPPDMPAGMGVGSVPIPMVSITQDAGKAIIASLASGPVTAEIKRTQAPDVDGTLDESIVGHEWGHYLHLRHVSCNSQQCLAQSEGWADFDAMLLAVHEGDDVATGSFALAQFAVVSFPDDPAYFGIRRFPYSLDFDKNPLVFHDITSGATLPTNAPIASQAAMSDNAEVHAAGEIWASMLVGSYFGMIQDPAHTYDEAHRLMSDYVVLGMTAAPADPTYTEQRDAVLAGAIATSPSDFLTIAQAFATRGAGTCAISPARESMDLMDVTDDFTLSADVTVTGAKLDDSTMSCDQDGVLDAGETGKLTVSITNAGAVPMKGATAVVTSTTTGVTFPKGGMITFADVPARSTMTGAVDVALDPSVKGQQTGTFSVALTATSCTPQTPFAFTPSLNYDALTTGATTDTVEAPTTAWTTSGMSADTIWARAEAMPGNMVWAGADLAVETDTQLVSPPLDVSTTDKLVMTFKQTYQFETEMGQFFDGGVIEVSSDGGTTWNDVSMYGDPAYTGKLPKPSMQSVNALGGRDAYVGTNPASPAFDTTTIDMGMSLAGKTIQVRFRIGTDDGGDAPGWQLDDIGFTGITNAPFSKVVDDAGKCATMGAGGAAGAAGAAGAGGSSGSAAGGAKGGAAGTTSNGGAASGHAGAATAGQGGASGASAGSTATAGHAGTAGAAGAAGVGNPAVAPTDDSGGGCGCSTATEHSRYGFGIAALGLIAAIRRRRSRA